MNAPQTMMEDHLQESLRIGARIREGLAPEPLTDDLLDKLPPITAPVVPAECETPKPIEISTAAVAFVGKNVKRQTMYGKMYRKLADEGRVNASDLTSDGYIGISEGRDFLASMADLGVLIAPGRSCQVMEKGRAHRLLVYVNAAVHMGGSIPRRRAA